MCRKRNVSRGKEKLFLDCHWVSNDGARQHVIRLSDCVAAPINKTGILLPGGFSLFNRQRFMVWSAPATSAAIIKFMTQARGSVDPCHGRRRSVLPTRRNGALWCIDIDRVAEGSRTYGGCQRRRSCNVLQWLAAHRRCARLKDRGTQDP
jgi:hypothetical protein